MDEMRVRRAGVGDADALVVLRAAMFRAMGTDPGGHEAPWRTAAARWFADALAQTSRFAAFVVDDADGWVVSGAAVDCELRTPGPANPTGGTGALFNVCTLPGWEGRGLARGCVGAVLAWAREETTVATVALAATPAGIGIYRGLGFTESDHPSMRLRIDR